MTHKTSSKFLVAAALFALGMIVAPSLASAGDSPAPIQPVNPAVIASYGGGMPLLASSGDVVTGNAWCDPLTGACEAHPWTHHKRF